MGIEETMLAAAKKRDELLKNMPSGASLNTGAVLSALKSSPYGSDALFKNLYAKNVAALKAAAAAVMNAKALSGGRANTYADAAAQLSYRAGLEGAAKDYSAFYDLALKRREAKNSALAKKIKALEKAQNTAAARNKSDMARFYRALSLWSRIARKGK